MGFELTSRGLFDCAFLIILRVSEPFISRPGNEAEALPRRDGDIAKRIEIGRTSVYRALGRRKALSAGQRSGTKRVRQIVRCYRRPWISGRFLNAISASLEGFQSLRSCRLQPSIRRA